MANQQQLDLSKQGRKSPVSETGSRLNFFQDLLYHLACRGLHFRRYEDYRPLYRNGCLYGSAPEMTTSDSL